MIIAKVTMVFVFDIVIANDLGPELSDAGFFSNFFQTSLS